MDILPAVDVLEGRVVRLHQGDYERVTDYGADIVARASTWMDQGARMVHIVDLDGARHGRPAIDLWEALGRSQIPFQVGGGIRTAIDAERAVSAGAHRVMMGTAAVWDPQILGQAIERVGAERIMASVDVSGDRAKGAGWLDDGKGLEEVVAGCLQAGVGRFLVTAVSRDGTMSGPDLDLIATVQEMAPEVALVAAGGIGTVRDLAALHGAGVEGAVVGRALYEGSFTLPEALRAVGAS